MPKKKDSLIIGAVLLIAVVLFIVSRVMPKTDLNQKTADVTLAPEHLPNRPKVRKQRRNRPLFRKKPHRLRRRLSRQKHRSPRI